MAGNSTDPGRSVTSKITAILMSVADGGVHTLTDLAGAADLPTSTAHRLASELVAWRLLERTEERSYRIALALRMIGSDGAERDTCSHALTIRRCLPALDELSRATKSDVRLGILRGDHVLLLQPSSNWPTAHLHAESLLHSMIPAHATASGKALLAFSPAAIVDHLINAGLPAFTPHTITAPAVLRQRLNTTRLTRVAISRNEFKCGTAAMAMPIFHGRGRVAAAIELNIAGLGNDLKPAASALAVACRSLSRQLTTDLRVTNSATGDPKERGSVPRPAAGTR